MSGYLVVSFCVCMGLTSAPHVQIHLPCQVTWPFRFSFILARFFLSSYILSYIFYLFLLLWCYPCLLYIFDGAVLSPSTSATECGQNRINKYWSSDIFFYNEYIDQWVGHVRFSALSRQMHLTFLYVYPTTFATSPLLPIGASPSSPSS
jgi:hypothetical protein